MTYSAAAYHITDTFNLSSSAEGGNSTVVCTNGCILLKLDCYNTGPAGLRLAFYNKASLPVPGDTPVWITYLPGQQETSKDWNSGLVFPAGIAITIMAEQDGDLTQGIVQALNIGFTKQ